MFVIELLEKLEGSWPLWEDNGAKKGGFLVAGHGGFRAVTSSDLFVLFPLH